jgi:hypothetical protein
MQLNTVSFSPASNSASTSRAPAAAAAAATSSAHNVEDYQPSYVGKKPKRKKKHRRKDREQPDLAAKLRAEAAENGETYGRSSKRARTADGTYDGTTTSGTAAANILSGSDQGRAYTVSVALPGSIVANAQSRELRTYLVGQIARSLAIFNIDEVIVYDDRSVASEEDSGKRRPYGDPCHFMARVLQYLETPQVSFFCSLCICFTLHVLYVFACVNTCCVTIMTLCQFLLVSFTLPFVCIDNNVSITFLLQTDRQTDR